MQVIELSLEGLGDFKLKLMKGSYAGGKLALRLIDFEDGAPFIVLTVNIPNEDHQLQPGEFFVKSWSENEPSVNELRKKVKIFIDTGRRVSVGRVTAEIWKFADDDIINRLEIL